MGRTPSEAVAPRAIASLPVRLVGRRPARTSACDACGGPASAPSNRAGSIHRRTLVARSIRACIPRPGVIWWAVACCVVLAGITTLPYLSAARTAPGWVFLGFLPPTFDQWVIHFLIEGLQIPLVLLASDELVALMRRLKAGPVRAGVVACLLLGVLPTTVDLPWRLASVTPANSDCFRDADMEEEDEETDPEGCPVSHGLETRSPAPRSG